MCIVGKKDLNSNLNISHATTGLSFWYSFKCVSIKFSASFTNSVSDNKEELSFQAWTSFEIVDDYMSFNQFVVGVRKAFYARGRGFCERSGVAKDITSSSCKDRCGSGPCVLFNVTVACSANIEDV